MVKLTLSLLVLVPTIAVGQTNNEMMEIVEGWIAEDRAKTASAPVGIPVQPVLPVPADNGVWGTGYSIVTTTRPVRSLFDRDLTGSETVQRVVPNDGLGRPMTGLSDW